MPACLDKITKGSSPRLLNLRPGSLLDNQVDKYISTRDCVEGHLRLEHLPQRQTKGVNIGRETIGLIESNFGCHETEAACVPCQLEGFICDFRRIPCVPRQAHVRQNNITPNVEGTLRRLEIAEHNLVFMKVLQCCGNIMGASQLLLHQDINFATSPVHHFIHKTGCLDGLLLRPRRNDPLLEAIIKPVDHYKVIGCEFAA
mmetsp:Transcript_17834/g.41617  ORF Transcript_17834/g.41617 Transcript_17834/m.41617 type:complete len:201 (-) Transcript_17834:284-886(-)